MSATIHLAVDAAGGDSGIRCTVPTSLRFLRERPDVHLHLVGDERALARLLPRPRPANCSTLRSERAIPMGAGLAQALRCAAGSSMQGALGLVAGGACQGLVSAGDTGALMALARRELGMVEDFHRPALCARIPTLAGSCYMLDLGANVDCTPGQLLEFSRMGVALSRLLEPRRPARVGLLSNGVERGKGNRLVRAAHALLERQEAVEFRGNIEACDIQRGVVEVVVCDGFSGNIALKAMEGTGAYLRQALPARLREPLERASDPRRHNGALLLGLDGVVVKSHGGADADGFHAALTQAAAWAEALRKRPSGADAPASRAPGPGA